MSSPSQRHLFETNELTSWEEAAQRDQLVADVVFNRPLQAAYSYLVPNELREWIGPARRVKVSFGRGNQTTVGFCVGVRPWEPTNRKLKPIVELLDREPLLDDKMMELTRWISEHYLCGWGQVLESVIPAGVKKKSGTRMVTLYTVPDRVRQNRDSIPLPLKQARVLDILCQQAEPMAVEDICEKAECGTSPIHSLRDKKLIDPVRHRAEQFDLEPLEPTQQELDLTLNEEQQAAFDKIITAIRTQQHSTMLLHGVTGSGKTEIYIQTIREVVSYGKQAIVLVPEISLTPQTIRRFRRRFDNVAVLHSHLTDAERHWHWQQITRGEVQVVVGARSAIFAPCPQLGLIVIDEEHENTFKQETTPRYHAREVARHRAELEKIPLVLGTATPTFESWLKVHQKEYDLVSMPKRVAKLPLPPVVIVDVRNDPQITKGAAIGRALESAMRLTLNDGGQIILFLNLRGFSPTMWCKRCGKGIQCPDCDITLTWHKDKQIALCHSCDYQIPPPTSCPNCDHPGLRFIGIGTQKLEQEVRTKFSNQKCLRMDSDSMSKRGSHDETLEIFRAGKASILLGTQMIAKGLDFPNVTLVGVIDADTMLHQPDLRATERTFQLISQVAGRTGRSSRGGRVFVQTASPGEPAIVKAAEHDYIGFARNELRHRHSLQAPPFSKMARIIFRGEAEQDVQAYALEFTKKLKETIEKESLDVLLLGPAPAPIAKLKRHFRFHLQVRAPQLELIHQLWRSTESRFPKTSTVEFIIDVEPANMR
ncbi:Primosomal protein N' [Polystyrenella longa]|uniref:Replication restart protein PriA n=1 Tax=Polystyrenella longa TaxID=2528007 RepID=A0A518CJU4_9PLAN|nr:primosomal protein N' [Polystyrenella longa]QDU79495.1 Primosomal protein N' [Polystyrenella longa]